MGELTFDALVLAGGRGVRLGGVTKADLAVGGVRLLDRVLAGVAGARTSVVVGQVAVPEGVLRTCEEPAGTGPAAGIAAGLAAIDSPAEWTIVLACDLPGAQAAVTRLLAEPAPAADGRCLATDEGGPQWLLGLYRTASLVAALAAYGDPRNRSVRGLLGRLELEVIPDPDGHGYDLDTWADHARWNRRLAGSEDRSGWEPFVERVCAALEVDPARIDIDEILTLSREIAHTGARAMAPVSAYILGIAVGSNPTASPEYLRRVLEDAATAAPLPKEP